jgi:hypothetical protein
MNICDRYFLAFAIATYSLFRAKHGNPVIFQADTLAMHQAGYPFDSSGHFA